MAKFFSFDQNNSGGSFVKDDSAGISEYVIIEANDSQHANRRAEDIGLYFNGCDTGNDCECCGDRWYQVSDSDATEVPESYGKPIETAKKRMGRKNVHVHYLDGTFKKVSLQD